MPGHHTLVTLPGWLIVNHYNDVIMSAMASHITSLIIFNSTVYSGADKRKHQSSATLAFVRGINRWPVNSPHKWPVTPKMFPFDDIIIVSLNCFIIGLLDGFVTVRRQAIKEEQISENAKIFPWCVISIATMHITHRETKSQWGVLMKNTNVAYQISMGVKS